MNLASEPTITVLFRCDWPLAFRLHVVSATSRQLSRGVLAGPGSVLELSLTSGINTIAIHPFGDSEQGIVSTDIEIGPSTHAVELHEWFDRREVGRMLAKAETARTMAMSAITRASRKREKAPFNRECAIRHVKTVDPESDLQSGEEWVAALGHLAEVPYVVGLSQLVAPRSLWVPASGVDVAIERQSTEELRLAIRPSTVRTRTTSSWLLSIKTDDRPRLLVSLPQFRHGVRIRIRPLLLSDVPDVTIEIEALEPSTSAILRAHRTASPEEAMAVVEWAAHGQDPRAIRTLITSPNDLWRATAAAVLLADINELDDVVDAVIDLARRALHICDAAVAGAWALAFRAKEARPEVERSVLERLQVGRKAGIPAFSATYTLALTLLEGLCRPNTDDAVRGAAAEELEAWSNCVRGRLFNGPCLIVEEHSGAADMNEKCIRRLASGVVNPKGFHSIVEGSGDILVETTGDSGGDFAVVKRPDTAWGAMFVYLLHQDDAGMEALAATAGDALLRAPDIDRLWTSLKALADQNEGQLTKHSRFLPLLLDRVRHDPRLNVRLAGPGIAGANDVDDIPVVATMSVAIISRWDNPLELVMLPINEDQFDMVSESLGVPDRTSHSDIIAELAFAREKMVGC